MSGPLEVRGEVEAALAAGRAVVALESALLSHGLPRPLNLETATRMESAVRAAGAVPATIGLAAGRAVVGLAPEEMRRLAAGDGVAKASLRDLAPILARRGLGGTTVAATARLAARAGIRVLATGGIGGVHRGADGFDVSADLEELARAPLAVVSSGAKSILDLARTLEALETLGVPVIGYRTDELPGFYSRGTGLELPHRVETPTEAAVLMRLHWQLESPGGIVFAQPPPAASALERGELEEMLEAALAEAAAAGVRGAASTPFLLERLAAASGGRTLAANVDLLLANARLAAEIATAWSATTGPRGPND